MAQAYRGEREEESERATSREEREKKRLINMPRPHFN